MFNNNFQEMELSRQEILQNPDELNNKHQSSSAQSENFIQGFLRKFQRSDQSKEPNRDKNKIETKVLKLEKSNENPESYFFPTFLRVKINKIKTLDSETRFSDADIDIYLSVFYGSVDQKIVDQLKKGIYLKSEFNYSIKLDQPKKKKLDQSKSEKDELEIYFTEYKKVLHWNIVFKSFQSKIFPFVFFHPFSELHVVSKLKIPSIEIKYTKEKESKKVIANFNILDCEKEEHKILEDESISEICGFNFSNNWMDLSIEKEHEYIIRITDKENMDRGMKLTDRILSVVLKQENSQQGETENSGPIEDEIEDSVKITFPEKLERHIENSHDLFSTAAIRIHFHSSMFTALFNYFSNLIVSALLGFLSILIHYQKREADSLISSVATIGVAFGAFILSIRQEIPFKPSFSCFEYILMIQIGLLFIPLGKYLSLYGFESIQPVETTLNQAWKKNFNFTEYFTVNQTVLPETTFQFNTMMLDYFQELLNESKSESMFYPNIETDNSYKAHAILICVTISYLVVLILGSYRLYSIFERSMDFDMKKAKNEFFTFSRKKWSNEVCRKYFEHERFKDILIQLPDIPQIEKKEGTNRVVCVEKKEDKPLENNIKKPPNQLPPLKREFCEESVNELIL